jgi:hypothetical protein
MWNQSKYGGGVDSRIRFGVQEIQQINPILNSKILGETKGKPWT